MSWQGFRTRLLFLVRQALGAERALLFLRGEEGLFLAGATHNQGIDNHPEEKGVLAMILRQGKPFRSLPDRPLGEVVYSAEVPAAWMAAPVGDPVRGVLVVEGTTPFSEIQQHVLSGFSRQWEDFSELETRVDALANQVNQRDQLVQALDQVAASTDLDTAGEIFLSAAGKLFGGTEGLLLLPDPEADQGVRVLTVGDFEVSNPPAEDSWCHWLRSKLEDRVYLPEGLPPDTHMTFYGPEWSQAPSAALYGVSFALAGTAQPALLVLIGSQDEDHQEQLWSLPRFIQAGGQILGQRLLMQQMEALATLDGLTGLLNRRAFQNQLHQEEVRAERFSHALSLVMFDVDHFKSFNDTHGHAAGDAVLRQVAATVSQHVRDVDIVARYGGEEFVVVLPNCPKDFAREAAERMREAIEKSAVDHEGKSLQVTSSFGCATFPSPIREAQDLLEAADKALYRAKNEGRNRVCVFGPEDRPD